LSIFFPDIVPVVKVEREKQHIKCPICGGDIKFNKQMAGGVKWDKQKDCHNEWLVHVGDTLYQRSFKGHTFPVEKSVVSQEPTKSQS
jgi:hypothetical protein